MKALTRTATLLAAIVAVSALAGVSAQAAERCRTAEQCKGPLPQICVRCKDGKDVCAHWPASATAAWSRPARASTSGRSA
jgi:hypothetical protein